MAIKNLDVETQDVPSSRPNSVNSGDGKSSGNTGSKSTGTAPNRITGETKDVVSGITPMIPSLPPPPVASSENKTVSVDNLTKVRDLIDTLQKPPTNFSTGYLLCVQRTCSFLNLEASKTMMNALKQSASTKNFEWESELLPEQSTSSTTANARSPEIKSSNPASQLLFRNSVNFGRNAVFDLINKINSFISRAKNAGFVPQNNPFVKAASYNIGRNAFTPVNLTAEDANEIVKNIQIYMALKQADEKGELKFDSNLQNSAQLSSATFSLKGLGGSGDALVDLSKILPNADDIKQQKALEALSVFDFTKRIPKVLFTSHYSPNGTPRGIIVGWRKIPDASGYIIKRKNIFTGKEITYSIDNIEAKKQTNTLSDYVKTWVLSFYDSLTIDAVSVFLDSDVETDAYYIYRLQAYQEQNESPGKIFSVPVSQKVFNNAERINLRNLIEQVDPAKGPDSVSPYPFLSQLIFGNQTLDWLLAAINIRESINRGDPRSVTRSYSYLTAQLDFLLSQSALNRFVVPKNSDASITMNNIQNSISSFGIGQVIKEVLQETGVMYYFEGKDPADNSLFSNIPVQQNTTKGIVPTVLAAVDPETLILNLDKLSTNMSELVSGNMVENIQLNSGATPVELDVSSDFDNPTVSLANDGLKFRQDINIDGDSLDITTPIGIGKLVRTIRVISDNLNKIRDVKIKSRNQDPIVKEDSKDSKKKESARDKDGNELVVRSSRMSDLKNK